MPITSYQNDVNYDGSYSYSYTTGDGSQQQARGFVKNLGQKEIETQVVQGSYSYTSPDGTPISVTYIADENGKLYSFIIIYLLGFYFFYYLIIFKSISESCCDLI